MVIGGLLTAFTNTTVLNAWGDFFSAPWHAISLAWDTAIGVYVELFQGSIFSPHTVAQFFQQASLSTAVHNGYLSAVFGPLSNTFVYATPLILTGLAVALPYQSGLFNIGGESQWIGGAIVATYLGYGVSLPPGIHVIVCVLGGFVGGAATGGGRRPAEGDDGRPRGHRHDHAQLHHGRLPGLPALLPLPDAGAGR